uniref:Fatty acid hydroxylase domain-containing protein n=1 Tax=Helicotheca tamesis TaxID=374047 RepID=A0A7S2MS67_9STRA
MKNSLKTMSSPYSTIPPRQNEPSIWTIVAAVQSMIWLFVLPQLCRPVWHHLGSFSPVTVEVLLTTSSGVVQVVLFNLCMLPIYYMQHPFFEQYKIQFTDPWPWTNKSPKVRDEFWALSLRSVKITTFNLLCLIPCLVLLKTCAFSLLGLEPPPFQTDDESWPTHVKMMRDNILMTLLHEFGFYSTHRLMHTYPSLYKYHKIHHEYKMNTTLAAQHNHPVDYIISIGTPALMSSAIVQPHSFVFFQWSIWVVYANLDDHCGYSFPWSPVRWFPFAALTDEHEFHHLKNLGCFGSKLDLYEKLLQGGNKWYDVWLEKQRELRSSLAGVTEKDD